MYFTDVIKDPILDPSAELRKIAGISAPFDFWEELGNYLFPGFETEYLLRDKFNAVFIKAHSGKNGSLLLFPDGTASGSVNVKRLFRFFTAQGVQFVEDVLDLGVAIKSESSLVFNSMPKGKLVDVAQKYDILCWTVELLNDTIGITAITDKETTNGKKLCIFFKKDRLNEFRADSFHEKTMDEITRLYEDSGTDTIHEVIQKFENQ